MDILQIAEKVLKTGPVCDNCLGRQFAQLLSGYTNKERGAAIRTVLAMRAEKGGEYFGKNFSEIKFRLLKMQAQKEGTAKEAAESAQNGEAKGAKTETAAAALSESCHVCGGIFTKIGGLERRIEKEVSDIEFETFHIGVTLSKVLLEKEEALWDGCGIDYCESIKTEIGRETGKMLSASLKKTVDLKKPDIVILLNFEKNSIEATISPVFFKGKYKKFAKIPQTVWYCPRCHGLGCDNCNWSGRLSKTSVQEIIAEPMLKAAKGTGTRFHGAGREDADVLCLDWRDFVIEVLEPRKRSIDLSKIKFAKADLKKVQISALSPATHDDVLKAKTKRAHKTYRMEIGLEKPVKEEDLKGLEKLKTTISQKTPVRVLPRRADIVRKRRVLSVKYRMLSSKKLELAVETEAGLYVKELVSGDGGRTKPSVSEILGTAAEIKKMEVVGIE